MITTISRTTNGELLLTIAAEYEVEGIALDAWAKEHPGSDGKSGMLIITRQETATRG